MKGKSIKRTALEQAEGMDNKEHFDSDKPISGKPEIGACKHYQPEDFWLGIGPIPCKNCGKLESQHLHIWNDLQEKEDKMKGKSNKNEGSETSINQLHHLAGPNPSVPNVPKPSAPAVAPSSGTTGGYNVAPSSGTTGGTVSTSRTTLPEKGQLKDAGRVIAKSEAATLRNQAQQLRVAANTCSYNLANLGWLWCKVTVEFENNREITIEEAVAYAKILDQRALMAAIDAAIQTPGATGPMSCNLFVGTVGEKLDIPYFRNPIDDDHHMANNMYDFISKAIGFSASGWVKLDEDEVQDKADEGKLVVGVAHSIEGRSVHGHIAIAVSSNLPKVRPHGRNIPCVLDGQHAKKKVSCTPDVFGDSVTTPIWAFYKD